MKHLGTAHLAVGLAGVLAFFLSGQYMHHLLDHLKHMPDGPRMLYRTAHIYLMWAAGLNLVLGAYLTPLAAGSVARRLQLLASALVLAAPVLIGMSFLLESGGPTLARPLCRLGIYAGFAGPVLHVAAGWLRRILPASVRAGS